MNIDRLLRKRPAFDAIDTCIEFVTTPLYKWPVRLRRAFLLLFPLAVLLRVAVFLVLILAMMLAYMCEDAGDYFKSIWNGERP